MTKEEAFEEFNYQFNKTRLTKHVRYDPEIIRLVIDYVHQLRDEIEQLRDDVEYYRFRGD